MSFLPEVVSFHAQFLLSYSLGRVSLLPGAMGVVPLYGICSGCSRLEQIFSDFLFFQRSPTTLKGLLESFKLDEELTQKKVYKHDIGISFR